MKVAFQYFLDKKGIKAEARDIYIDEIVDAYKNGELKEIFGAGTAAVVSHVASLTHNELKMTLPPVTERKIGNMLKKERQQQ